MSAAGNPAKPNVTARRPSWTDLPPRLLSAVVLVLVVAVALFVGSYAFAALAAAAFAGAYREWETMVTRRPLSPIAYGLIGLVGAAALVYPWLGALGTAAAILIAVVLAALERRPDWLWRAGGLVFMGLVIAAALSLRGDSMAGTWATAFFFVVIWLTDTGAFFTGRQVGGEKLAPGISPSKTWSGAVGGLVLGTLAGTALWFFIAPSPWWIGGLLAALTSVVGQLGDLAESAVKRQFRIKDSGDLIPGHGGLMDRMDSLTFGALFLTAIGLAHGGGNVASGLLNW